MSVDFEARYRAEPDPWGYTQSAYERDKYAATLDACGPGPFSRALELGGSIGVFSAPLAPRCLLLDTLDLAPTAVASARTRLDGQAHVQPSVGEIPQDVPSGPYDLVVASEVLYYLESERFARTLTRLAEVLDRGGRIVAVHWRPTGPERPLSAAKVHRTLRAQPWLASLRADAHPSYLLDVLERR